MVLSILVAFGGHDSTKSKEEFCRNGVALASGSPLPNSAATATIADKGYDADHLRVKIAEIGAGIIIRVKRARDLQRPYDAVFYKERNRIERLFSKLKQFRLVATRYGEQMRIHI